MLSSQFQGFCRDLHSECTDALIADLPIQRQALLRIQFLHGVKLNHGNPNPGNLGADFGRFGFRFWDAVKALDARNEARRDKLERLNLWRNAIAHQDWEKVGGDPRLGLTDIRQWRSALNALGGDFDRILRDRVGVLSGSRPW